MQDLIITNVIEEENKIIIYAELEVKEQVCPCCGGKTKLIHYYRKQIIKNLPIAGKNVEIHYRKRRYRCLHCHKRFAEKRIYQEKCVSLFYNLEKNSFLPRYYRVTSRVIAYVYEKLREVYSYTSVGKQLNLSVTTIMRYLDLVSYSNPKSPPDVIAIDEFK